MGDGDGKTVTVFSTLIAVVTVVGGFTLLDAATLRVSLVRAVVVAVLSALGLAPRPATLDAVLGIAGLVVIAGGAAVYVVGTRFRAPGMGKSQADGDGGSDDG